MRPSVASIWVRTSGSSDGLGESTRLTSGPTLSPNTRNACATRPVLDYLCGSAIGLPVRRYAAFFHQPKKTVRRACMTHVRRIA